MANDDKTDAEILLNILNNIMTDFSEHIKLAWLNDDNKKSIMELLEAHPETTGEDGLDMLETFIHDYTNGYFDGGRDSLEKLALEQRESQKSKFKVIKNEGEE